MSETRLFTSESVSDGHPDKICDQLSDAILDNSLMQDKDARVAVEVAAKGNSLYFFGENSVHFDLDEIKSIAGDTLYGIGYGDPYWRFHPDELGWIINISDQSPEIAAGITKKNQECGAGDQGIMFGYAVKETPEMMPLPISLAHRLMREHYTERKHTGVQIGPDAKAQVTVEYTMEGEPVAIDTVVLSTVHHEDMSLDRVRAWGMDFIERVLEDYDHMMGKNTKFFINPAGQWNIGGPVSDAGLTGRKIIVDTYGGSAPHGGGAFSGKDPTKVDRSAAYAARYLAKNICQIWGRRETEIQLSYAIGQTEPVAVYVKGESLESGMAMVRSCGVDLTPNGIIRGLGLKSPIYEATAAFGHFGVGGYSWEHVRSSDDLLPPDVEPPKCELPF